MIISYSIFHGVKTCIDLDLECHERANHLKSVQRPGPFEHTGLTN